MNNLYKNFTGVFDCTFFHGKHPDSNLFSLKVFIVPRIPKAISHLVFVFHDIDKTVPRNSIIFSCKPKSPYIFIIFVIHLLMKLETVTIIVHICCIYRFANIIPTSNLYVISRNYRFFQPTWYYSTSVRRFRRRISRNVLHKDVTALYQT